MEREHPTRNRRKIQRIPTERVVCIRIAAKDESTSSLDGKMTNLSRRGAFVETAAPLPEGTRIRLDCIIEGSGTKITMEGTVRWHQTEKEPKGMGVEFT